MVKGVMSDKMPASCLPFLQRVVAPGECVIAAVSGGADSMAMLDVLLEYREAVGYRVEVAHIHHHLRTASDGEWQFVEQYCAQRQVPFHGRHIYVREAQEKTGRSMEAEAHHLRYDALYEIVEACDAQWLALAHHANDRAETVLMNILRGTSGYGLAAMQPCNGSIIRPLLECSRAEIEEYCVGRGIPWVTDESNADTTILRNRLRHELLPILETYNPNVVAALNRLSEASLWEQDYIEQSAGACLQEAMVLQAEQWCLLRRTALKERHVAVLSALLRQCVKKYSKERHSLRFDIVTQAIELMKAGHGRYDLGQGLLCECTQQWIFIGRTPVGEWQQTAQGWTHAFLQAQLTAEGLEAPFQQLAVRGYESGDTIQLPHLGHKKIKKILQEKGMPVCLRNSWPIVYDIKTKEVIWVPFLAQMSLLMYYNSVTFMKTRLKITIADKETTLIFREKEGL